MLSNADLSELLRREAEREDGHRRRALRYASRAAMMAWPEEASMLAVRGRSLLELPSVGPWVAGKLRAWLDDPPPVPEPDEDRRDFLTLARAREAVGAEPGWRADLQGDLQVHTTYSDGSTSIREMAEAAMARDHAYVAITDHSASLSVARGMDERKLAEQGREIAALNEELAADGSAFRILRSIELDVFPDGSLDLSPEALAPLDLVLGAFHTALRSAEDQTERYLRALRDPNVHILAHPRGRRFDRRVGIRADWERVIEEAARQGKALEIDGSPERQDLNLELLTLVREARVWVATDTDAHAPRELDFMVFALAAAILAGIPRERVLNLMRAEDVVRWAGDR